MDQSLAQELFYSAKNVITTLGPCILRLGIMFPVDLS